LRRCRIIRLNRILAGLASPNPDGVPKGIGKNFPIADFTLLPGSVPSATEDATVVRVEMQRAALGALGLPVNEERAGDWIQVDLLIGDDGLPQAVRLPQTTN
jgi:hypothetical protein